MDDRREHQFRQCAECHGYFIAASLYTVDDERVCINCLKDARRKIVRARAKVDDELAQITLDKATDK